MKRTLLLTVAMIFAGSVASALTPDEVVADFQEQGYTRIEVTVGPTQIKVEAIKGDEKVETIYDAETGSVLKSETEAIDAGEDTTPGVELRERRRDFVRVDDDDEDRGKGHGRGRGHDDDDGDDDDDDGEDHDRGHGNDDDHDDSDNPGKGGGGHGSGGGGGSDDGSDDDSDED